MRGMASYFVLPLSDVWSLRMLSEENYVTQLDATIQSASQRQRVLERWCSNAQENSTAVFNAIEAQLSFLEQRKTHFTASILWLKPQLDKVETVLSQARHEYDLAFASTNDPIELLIAKQHLDQKTPEYTSLLDAYHTAHSASLISTARHNVLLTALTNQKSLEAQLEQFCGLVNSALATKCYRRAIDARKQFGESHDQRNGLFEAGQDSSAKAWPGAQSVGDEISYSNIAGARPEFAKVDFHDRNSVDASFDGDFDAAGLPAIDVAANASISSASPERVSLFSAVTSRNDFKGEALEGKKEASVQDNDEDTDLSALLDEGGDVDHGADFDDTTHNVVSDAAAFGDVEYNSGAAAGVNESIAYLSASDSALLEHADVDFFASDAATSDDADHDVNAALNKTQYQRSSIGPFSVIDGPLLDSANGTTAEVDDAILNQIYEEVASVTPAQYSPWKPSDTISADAEDGSLSNILLDLNLDDDDDNSAAAAFIQLRSLSGSRASYGVASSANSRRLCSYLDNHVESLSGTASPIRQTEQNLLALAHLMVAQS